MCRCDQIIAGRASSGRIAGSVLRITRGRRAPRHQQGDARVTARLPARLPARFPGLRIFAITVIHGGEELVHEQDPPARHDAGHGHHDAVTSQGHAAASNKRANAAVQKGTNDCAPGVVKESAVVTSDFMILLRATVSGRRPWTGTSMAVASKTTPRQSQAVQEEKIS